MRHHFLFIFTNCSLVAINHYLLVRHFLVKFLKLYKLASVTRYFCLVVLSIYIYFMVSLIICDSYLLPCILPIDDKAFKPFFFFFFFNIHFYVSRTSDSVWLIIIWWMSEWIMNESCSFLVLCLCSYCPCVWDICFLWIASVLIICLRCYFLLTALFERNLFCIAMVMNYFHMALAPLCFVL